MKLKNFVMVMFANDTMVDPKESEVCPGKILVTVAANFKTKL